MAKYLTNLLSSYMLELQDRLKTRSCSMTKRTRSVLSLLCRSVPRSVGHPDFKSDEEADRWVRNHSALYRKMANAVDRRGGYRFNVTTQFPGGVAYFKDGRGCIDLNEVLKGSHRVSVIIFELTNLYHENRHQEVTEWVRSGELNNAAAFGLLHELIEYDGLRLHRKVLLELQPVLEIVPPNMITWVSTTAKSFAEYQLPFVYDYVKAQATSGHTAHYLKLFETHRAEHLDRVHLKKATDRSTTTNR